MQFNIIPPKWNIYQWMCCRLFILCCLFRGYSNICIAVYIFLQISRWKYCFCSFLNNTHFPTTLYENVSHTSSHNINSSSSSTSYLNFNALQIIIGKPHAIRCHSIRYLMFFVPITCHLARDS